MYTRYKKIGKNTYAYQVQGYWDPKKKITRHTTKYLGKVVDAKRRKFEKTLYKRNQEKSILDFGDVHVVSLIYKRCGLEDVVRKTFGEHASLIEMLVFNRVLQPMPMKSVYYWASNTYLSRTHNIDILETQRISRTLKDLGTEETQRRFFSAYTQAFKRSGCNLFDITPLPTSMSNNLAAWGYSDSGIDFQIKLALLVDKDHSMPLWYRMLPGNLTDVSTLSATVKEAKKLGLKTDLLILDRGFFSNNNIKALKENKSGFLIPLPSKTKLFNTLAAKYQRIEEDSSKAFKLGKRILFGSKEMSKGMYVYVILDPERRVRERNELHAKRLVGSPPNKFETYLKRKGFMVLLSTENMTVSDAVSLYYTRDFAEKCFKYFKSDLAILPLRMHSEETLAGYLLINFLALALYLQLRNAELDVSLDDAFQILRGVKKKIYENEEIVTEATKKQKEILNAFKIHVPK
ncbi:MAG: transposase [Candidatus Aenigmarchaeota archaeon]|nr:transposase [Candidatus Aenigmarchaeota archaeon]